MFAHIIIIARLPRRLAFFDYAVPSNLDVDVGDIVEVRFRNRITLGVVSGMSTSSTINQPQSISQVVQRKFLTPQDLKRYQIIADHLEQSVGAIILSALGRTLLDNQLPTIQAKERASVSRELLSDVQVYLDIIKHQDTTVIADTLEAGILVAKGLRKSCHDQLLILVPQERDVDLISQNIDLGPSTARLHGKTKDKDRGAIIVKWQNGGLKTLIASRQGALLPVHKLEAVVVLRSGHKEYRSERRNPRFDAREAVKLLTAEHQAKLVFVDDLPRLEEAADIVLPKRIIIDSKIIDLTAQEERTSHPWLSYTLLEEIKKALQSQKKVLLCFNRKGVGKRLQCASCGHLPTCGTCGQPPVLRRDDLVCPSCGTEMWYPKSCSKCGGKKLKFQGLGKTKIAETLKELFPAITIAEIEKGKTKETSAQILVATEYFFTSVIGLFPAKIFGLVADMAPDLSLFADDFRAQETAIRKFLRLKNLANTQNAVCLIQSWMPEVFRNAQQIKKFITKELATRERFKLPPYRARVTETKNNQGKTILIYDGPYDGKS